MKNPVLMVALIVMTVAVGLHFGTAFAMHDSTLDVNTWIARNNTTQLHTIDLNKGPISPPDTAGASTPEETPGASTLDPTPGPVTPTDEDEDQASSDDEDEDDFFEEDGSNGDDEDEEEE